MERFDVYLALEVVDMKGKVKSLRERKLSCDLVKFLEGIDSLLTSLDNDPNYDWVTHK